MELKRWIAIYASGLIVVAIAFSASPTWLDRASWLDKETLPGDVRLYDEGGAKIDPALQSIMDRGGEVEAIVVFREGSRPDLEGLEVKYVYRLINGAAVRADPAKIRDLSKDERVARIYPDGSVMAAMPDSVGSSLDILCASRAVNADKLWAEGLDGSGVIVAVLDSGIDKGHPDLAGKVVGEVNLVDGEDTTDDLLGHGTLVAGIIAGSGSASGGKYRGIAPGASLLNVRVIDSSGNGQVSDIIAGIEWALDNDAMVLSLSLAGLNLGETNPPVTMAADNAMDSGAVVCVAAGNNG